MKYLFFSAATMAVVLSCSRENDNSEAPQNPISITNGKKLKRISDSDLSYTTYKWENNKLTRIEFYKDGFLQDYTKISYENNLRKIDSVFDVRNNYLRRNVYTFNSDELLVLDESYKVGYLYEKRMEALKKLNQGYITREQYLKEIDEIIKRYTPHMKELVAKIPYGLNSSVYTQALIEIEKNNDGLVREYRYAYDSRGYISKRTSFIDGKKGLSLDYNYSNDKKSLQIRYNIDDTRYYLTSFTFDGKKGVLSDIVPNKKADYDYNTLEWKVIDNNSSLTFKNYTAKYTYDNDGYPLTEERTYDDGSKLNRTFTWE